MSAPTSCGHKAGKAYDRVVPGPDSCTAAKIPGGIPHSIASSASASSLGGTSSPSAFAVLRLITKPSLDLESAAVTLSGTVTTKRRRKYCAYKAIWCVRGGGRNARRWLRQYDSQRGGHLHVGVDDVSGRQNDAEEGRQQPSEYGDESELCWRKRIAGVALDRRAGRNQKPGPTDVRSRGPGAERRQPLGRLWHIPLRHRLCRGRGQQEFGQVCRRQELDGRGPLLRPLHTSQHHTAPLYFCSHRKRLRSEGHANRLDARRGDREVRATAGTREGRGGSRRPIRQSVAQLMQYLLFPD